MNFRSGSNLATKCLLFAVIVIGGSIFVGSTGSPAGNIKTDNFYHPRPAASPMAEFYVATDGNDSGAGTSTDPFQTIYRAQQAVRATIAGTMTGNVIVDLEGGLYVLNQTVQFNQSDSGNSGYEVIYRNWTNAAPILSGGQAITGWTPYKNGIWMAP
ncbi:MAG TPA: hypothetical protein VKK79_11335, partial [Candidatus Lokiarchaeia archaeon]|nr:hypothetical protein [Candidatus Lokiarchaeia archaeon]